MAFSGKISTPYSSFGMIYASYIFIAAEGLIPLEPWRPVFMRAYMVLLARLIQSSILISFSFISDLIIPRYTAWLVGQISDSPKVHFSVDFVIALVLFSITDFHLVGCMDTLSCMECLCSVYNIH